MCIRCSTHVPHLHGVGCFSLCLRQGPSLVAFRSCHMPLASQVSEDCPTCILALYSEGWGYRCTLQHVAFTWDLGIQTQVLMITWQTFHLLSQDSRLQGTSEDCFLTHSFTGTSVVYRSETPHGMDSVAGCDLGQSLGTIAVSAVPLSSIGLPKSGHYFQLLLFSSSIPTA